MFTKSAFLIIVALLGPLALANAAEPTTVSEQLEKKRDELALSLGSFRFPKSSREFSIAGEYRFGFDLFNVSPLLGINGVVNGPTYYYGALDYEISLGHIFTLIPALGVGYYDQNDGYDLGGSLQFRSSVELSYRLNDWSHLGLTFSHISNAGLESRNPGADSLFVTYRIDIAALFGHRNERREP